ncbi:MAG: transcriptional regulator [Bacteroidetes bacterium GWF2_42_66]|nr:MAG: transcriptional regulator [Bacteroidetes bacterium GWA2_42_15]OFX98722.1 MAG: transcriptional regulator [Bacteroidetes bacterium GWE2_42_39]OFY43079.1 MAG: transcriptional regulator [Bacteroidetes bacterium GWF2_42_66]HBL77076.1 LacI family transcriptional regulator [Prolixibacteraceae bacterium]HCU59870.1 LacI family transcriptional regulator [Prolixibacteraceae bacterium]
MSKRLVSLKDMAKELGVSISTVSRALKNHPDISPEMTARIQQLACEREYSPNPLAMGLLKQQTKMIGVIVPDLVTHFYSSIISGIESIAKQHGYYILISSSNESFEKETESVQNLLNTRVEGLIVCLSQETSSFEHFEPLLRNEIPLVFFDRVCMTDQVSSVVANNVEAARSITCHFYENGCRRIAYIAGPGHLNISKERLDGYWQGLKDCGLKIDPDLLEGCNLSAGEAIKATARLLDSGAKPDAIFGINDTVAFAAMKEIKRRGLQIPDDIALVGFTDEFHATVVDPPLTSITHPTFEMGQEAARLFFRQVENPGAPPVQAILKTRLVIRKSSVRKD